MAYCLAGIKPLTEPHLTSNNRDVLWYTTESNFTASASAAKEFENCTFNIIAGDNELNMSFDRRFIIWF